MPLFQLVLIDDSEREIVLTDEPVVLGSAFESAMQLDSAATRHVELTSERVHAVAECLVGQVPLAAGRTRRLVGPVELGIGRSRLRIVERWSVDDANTARLGMALAESSVLPEVVVVEGSEHDLGRTLTLDEREREYVLGRASEADLALDDGAVSREHLVVRHHDGQVLVRDLVSTRGAFLGTARLEPNRFAVWAPEHMLLVGRTVLALRMPPQPTKLLSAIVEPEAPAITAAVASDVAPSSHAFEGTGAPIAEPPPLAPVVATPPRFRRIDILVFVGAAIFALFAVLAVACVLW